MKAIVYLMLGAAIGATIALLFAPKSGAELRAVLQSTAEEDTAKMQAEWQAMMAKTNQKMRQMQAGQNQVQDEVVSEEVIEVSD